MAQTHIRGSNGEFSAMGRSVMEKCLTEVEVGGQNGIAVVPILSACKAVSCE